MTVPNDFPQDPTLGPLSERLSPEAVLAACREQVHDVPEEERQRWRHARMIEALYHPGRYLRVAFVLLQDASIPDRRVWPEGDVIYLHTPVRTPMSRRGQLLRLNGIDTELYRFPNDRRLRGLRKFSATEPALGIWQGWLDANGVDEQLAPGTLQRHLLRYVPEQKWVVRLRAEPTGHDSGKVHKHRITVRAGSQEGMATLHARYTALRKYYKKAKPRFHTARVIGHDQELGLLAVKWAHGDDLLSVLRQRNVGDVAADVVDVVRAFHESAIPNVSGIGTSDLKQSADEAVRDLSATCPELRETLCELHKRLTDRLDRVTPVEPVTLHNDLHWKQFLFDEERITLLDFERIARGDPLIDLANLVTQVRMLGHRPETNVDEETAAKWSAQIIERWQSETGQQIDSQRLRCYNACSMLTLARGMMRHLRLGWRALAQRCLDLAVAELTATDREALLS